MNDFLWREINYLGWIFWTPWVMLSIKNLILLSTLGAPQRGIDRVQRTFAWLAHIAMIFTPWMNALGCVALPLCLIANNTDYIKRYFEHRLPVDEDASIGKRMLTSIVAKDVARQQDGGIEQFGQR